VADFNGDGKVDVLWRHTSGTLAIWFLDGPTITGSGILGSTTAAWTIVGAGDYNGDGKADLLWRDGAGTLAVWFLNGASVTSTALLGNVSTVWQVQ
jgi:hypothetical protein